MSKDFNYLYITHNNSIMGRFDSETYTKDNQGTILAIAANLADAKSKAFDLIDRFKLEPQDIIVSLKNKELRKA